MSSSSSSGSKGRTKRTKSQTSETTEDAPPTKKVRKVKPAPAVTQPPAPPPPPPPKPAEPSVLGSLPLYGEELPEGGYEKIPATAKRAYTELRDALRKIHDSKDVNKEEAVKERQRGLILFASIRRLNRLSHLYCKDAREQTQEQKLEVDDLHLQLQNLKYEAMHLRREISNCLEFRSRHEDVDLVDEQEFYSQAPDNVSKPEVTRGNEHQRMLCRLEWELRQRKKLYEQQVVLEKEIATEELAIKQNEEKLDRLQPALDSLQKATLPLQDMLGLPLDKMKEEESIARLLPEPLYILYVQARSYAEVEDKSLCVSLVGDADEAKSFQSGVSSQEDSDDDSGESDNEGEKGTETQKKRPQRKSISEPVDVSKAHPLSVKLTFTIKEIGEFELLLSYLPNFCAVCVLVTVATMEDHTHPGSVHLDRLTLLSCLFEGDSGRVSPNSVVSSNIRRHGKDNFSAAVRQYGFPYKWMQSLCGIGGLTTGGGGGGGSEGGGGGGEWGEGTVQLQVDTSVENMTPVMKALRLRFKSQVYLAKQIAILERHQVVMEEGEEEDQTSGVGGGGGGPGGSSSSAAPQSQLIRWKSVSFSEVQSLQFGSKVIFNLQDKTNRFYVATIQNGQDPYSVKMHCLVCLTTNYPATPPTFAIRLQTSSKKKEPHDIHVKNIEAQVNLHFRATPKEPSGRSLLTRQVYRLRECLDHYVAVGRGGSGCGQNIRGKGRLITFS